MVKKIKPYEYQEECLAKIAEVQQTGAKRALVVMASGLGKTFTAAFAVQRFFQGRTFGRVLILCHSEEILKQTKDKFKLYFGEEYNYGMFTSSRKTTVVPSFLFATFQTMKNHRKEFSKNEFSYVIVDEAHHSYARTYFPTMRYFEPEFLLGLTATPERLDGQKITEIYGEPVYELEFAEANNRKLLTECDYRLVLDDMTQEKLDEYVNGDEKLTMGQLNRTLFVPKRDEEIVRLIRETMAKLEDAKTMIFCRSIRHAQKIARLMGDEVALVYHGNGEVANKLALKAFKQGELKVIISVQMLNEGIDVPDANHIVFLRNTVSPAIFYQQLGRGTRLSAGKEKVVVQDFVANCERIRDILQLQREVEDFRTHPPKTGGDGGSDGDAGIKKNFTLNIATPEFKARMVDIVELLERAAKGREWTKEEIIAGLLALSHDGYMPSSAEIDKSDILPTTNTIKAVFNCHLYKVAQICGLKMCRQPTTCYASDYTDEELLEMFYCYAVSLGHWPSASELDANEEMPSYNSYLIRFSGGIKKIISMIEKEYNCEGIKRNIFWSRESIVEGFGRLIMEKGCIPREQDVNACSYLPSVGACRHIAGCGLRELYRECNGDRMLGLGVIAKKREPLDKDTIYKMQEFVRHKKKKIVAADLCSENGLPSKTTITQKKGWGMKELNELVGADEILAELAKAEENWRSD